MPHAITLVDALKRLLKAKGITYGELAGRIDMSEATVKRMFSQKNFTLQRLDQVLAASGIEFDELSRSTNDQAAMISTLTMAQEKEIINDPKLLVVAVSVMNQISVEQIVRQYTLTEAEVVRCLTRLDRIGILELLPNNRVKLLISRTFSWISNGPLQTYFREQAYSDFLDSRFDGRNELMRLVNVMLSKQSTAALLERLQQVAAEFALQHQHDSRLPYEQRDALSILVAARPWLPQAFKAMLREPTNL